MWRQEQFQRDSGPISTCQYLVSSNLGFSNPATAAALKHFVAGGSCLQDSSWQQAVNLVQSPLSEGSSNCTPPQCPPSPSFRDNCSHLAFLTASKHLIRQGSMAENNSDGMISSTSGDWWIRDQQQQQEQQQQQQQHQQQLSNWSSFQLNSCQSGVTSSAASEIEGTEWSPAQLACLGTPSDNDHLSKLAVAMDNTDFSSTSTLVDAEVSMSSFVGMSSNPMWGSILLCDGGNETEPSIESTSMEGLQEALYSKSLLRTRSDSMAHDNNNQAWDFPIKGMGFDTNDMNLSKFSPQLQQSFAQDDRFYSNRLMDMDTSWAIQEPQRQQQQQVGFGMDPFCDQIQGLNQPQFDNSGKVKQEADIYSNTNSSISNISSMGGLQSLDSFRSPTSITDLLNPVNKPFSESFAGGLNTLPQIPLSNDVPSRWMTHSSRLPAMLSQVLPSNSAKHSGLYGHSMSMMRPFSIDFSAPKTDHHRMHSQSAASAAATSTLAYDAKDHPHMALSGTKHLGEESRDQLTDTKRNISNDHGSSSEPFIKRSRIEQSPTLPFKVRKEKLGERITALQQLVAPFGKTDTASVLLEAIGYIKFLHEQVQALSNPYMKNNSNTVSSNRAANDVGKASWSGGGDKSKDSDEPRQDLRSRGLCLVPLHCTQQVATNDNGADYWTPAIGGCSR